eukprot:2218-Heterococcus_DN1.PRE.2
MAFANGAASTATIWYMSVILLYMHKSSFAFATTVVALSNIALYLLSESPQHLSLHTATTSYYIVYTQYTKPSQQLSS